MSNFNEFLKQSHPNFVNLEKCIQEYWEKIDVNKVIDEYRKLAEKLYFLDGPPYPSADTIHVGTARTKVLKDIIIRYNILKGYNVFRVPGYDCHGLPVEMEVEKKLGIKNKKEIEEKIGAEKFIEECKKLVEENVRGMTRQFKRLGTLFDWKNPYFTMDKEYMEAVWLMFKKAYEKGLVKEELRPAWWCPRCKTVLSDYEVTDKYVEKEDPSIFVKFPVKGMENTYLLIWTTTPWTLPANLAIAVHPEYEYAFVKVGNETWILAKELTKILTLITSEDYKIEKIVLGKELEGLKYEYILYDLVPKQKELEEKYPNIHTVILADFVTLEEGTGLVHIAPGHGLEDWYVCKKYNIPVFSPVDEEGKYTEDVPSLKGVSVFDANKEIIRILKEKGYLVYESTIVHRYPICWRCKTSLVQRAVKELFIYRTLIKDKLKEIVEKEVKIYPPERKKYFLQMIEKLPDWPIVRQRYWGIPIPLWRCPNGHEIVVASSEELEKLCGEKIPDLHVNVIDKLKIKCPYCGAEMKRYPGVFDVWADSGAASFALEKKAGKYPVDVILEGVDQFRGWFMSLLVEGYITKDQRPYNTIVVQGWVYDKYGRGMSKSAKIGLLDDNVYERIGGADILRFYIIYKVKPWEDLIYDENEIAQIKQFFIILWNIYKFAYEYMKLDNYNPRASYNVRYTLLDRLIIARFAEVIKKYKESMSNYEFSVALREIYKFVLEDLSRFYVRLSRDRAWKESDDPEKWAFYNTLYLILKYLIILLLPFIPHTAECLYQGFIKEFEKSVFPTVQVESFPEFLEIYYDEKLIKLLNEIKEVIETILKIRDEKKIKLRWPLQEVRLFLNSVYEDNALLYRDFGRKIIDDIKEIIKKATNVKNVIIQPIIAEIEIKKLQNEKYVYEKLQISNIENRYFISVALKTEIDKELWLEALAREIIRRIQVMRKELDLPIDATIEVKIYTEDPELLDCITKLKDIISSETRASDIIISTTPIEGKEWKIENKKIIILIKKI